MIGVVVWLDVGRSITSDEVVILTGVGMYYYYQFQFMIFVQYFNIVIFGELLFDCICLLDCNATTNNPGSDFGTKDNVLYMSKIKFQFMICVQYWYFWRTFSWLYVC